MKSSERKPPYSSTKFELAAAINRLIVSKALDQQTAASLLNVAQPKISAITNYRLVGFSVEKLMEMLALLDVDVEIRIRPTSEKGRVHVSAA